MLAVIENLVTTRDRSPAVAPAEPLGDAAQAPRARRVPAPSSSTSVAAAQDLAEQPGGRRSPQAGAVEPPGCSRSPSPSRLRWWPYLCQARQ